MNSIRLQNLKKSTYFVSNTIQWDEPRTRKKQNIDYSFAFQPKQSNRITLDSFKSLKMKNNNNTKEYM